MSEAHRQAPRRHSRLRIRFFKVCETIARVCGGRALYRALNLRPGRFAVRHERLAVGADSPLVGLRLVQLSDIHAGPFLAAGDLVHVVAAANALEPDLCLFTGDLISRTPDEGLLVLDDLAALTARLGTFAVFGNHDYRYREERRLAAAFAERGIRFLLNESVRPLGEESPLVLLGVEDLEEAKSLDLTAARAGLRPGDLEVVLSHNPAGSVALLSPATRLVLSGHTHGNQIDLPYLRTLGPHHPGERVELRPASETERAATLIVNRGLGVVGVPLRIFARPELVLVELVP